MATKRTKPKPKELHKAPEPAADEVEQVDGMEVSGELAVVLDAEPAAAEELPGSETAQPVAPQRRVAATRAEDGASRDTAEGDTAPRRSAHFPDLDEAKDRHSASFEQLLQVYYGSKGQLDGGDASLYQGYYRDILKAFEDRNGEIRKSFFCSHIIGAVAVTKKDGPFITPRWDFHLNFPTAGASEAQELLLKLRHLSIEVRRLLRGRNLRTCLLMIYDLSVSLLRVIDRRKREQKTKDPLSPEERQRLALLRQQLRQVTDYHIRMARLESQFEYFGGMLLGVLILPVFWLLFNLGLENISYFTGDSIYRDGMLVSLGAGAIGAVVSVMTRMMKSQGLTLNHEAGPLNLILLGAFRPLIGSVFGLAIFALIIAELLPLRKMALAVTPETTEGVQAIFFYGAIAFLAGFSERWAQDMLAVGQGSFASEATHENSVEVKPREGTERDGSVQAEADGH